VRKVAKVLKVAQINFIDMKILDVTNLTKRYQTTVPKTVRELLAVTTEDRIVWVVENGEVKVRRA